MAIAGLVVYSASCEYTTHAAIVVTRRVRMFQLSFVLLSGKGGIGPAFPPFDPPLLFYTCTSRWNVIHVGADYVMF